MITSKIITTIVMFISRVFLSKIFSGAIFVGLTMLISYFLNKKFNIPINMKIYPIILGYIFCAGSLIEFSIGKFLFKKGFQILLISGLSFFVFKNIISWNFFAQTNLIATTLIVAFFEIRKLLKGSSYFGSLKTLKEIDSMGSGDSYEKGRQFEEYVAQLYKKLGYKAMTTTEMRQKKLLPELIQKRGGSGEQGVDVVVYDHKNKEKILIQCKHYSSKVSNSAIQEIVAAIPLYKANRGIVITNNFFTEPAKELAFANNIFLMDRKKLAKFIESVNGIKLEDIEMNNQEKVQTVSGQIKNSNLNKKEAA